jgi:hypothetical protein
VSPSWFTSIQTRAAPRRSSLCSALTPRWRSTSRRHSIQRRAAGSAADPAAAPPATPADPPATQPAPTSEPAPATPLSCAADPNQPAPTPITPAATLWQRQVKADGAPFTYSDFEGIVEAVCADTGQLLVSADDIREGAKDILFSVPSGVVATKVQVGESVLVTANIGAGGSLALTGLASDERTKGADDLSQAQGDLAGSKTK